VKMIIALSKHLKNMHTFDWDGLELPRDQLWDELRTKSVLRLVVVFLEIYVFFSSSSCPQLKAIFTNVGTRPLDPGSALFSFTNLASFSLIVRHGLGGSGKSQHVSLFPCLIIYITRSFPGPRRNPTKILGHGSQQLSRPSRTSHLQFFIFGSSV
jgi:hypothetical protein